MASVNTVFTSKTTSWGTFLLVPEDLLSALDKFNYDGLEYCELCTVPVQYYLSTFRPKFVKYVGSDVVKFDPVTHDEYLTWLHNVKY